MHYYVLLLCTPPGGQMPPSALPKTLVTRVYFTLYGEYTMHYYVLLLCTPPRCGVEHSPHTPTPPHPHTLTPTNPHTHLLSTLHYIKQCHCHYGHSCVYSNMKKGGWKGNRVTSLPGYVQVYCTINHIISISLCAL